MTTEEKKAIIEEAQKYVDDFFDTPIEPMYFEVRGKYGCKYDAISTLYEKLTGKLLMVVGEDHRVKEMEVKQQ